jgi:ketosteroid isomerase-like protein
MKKISKNLLEQINTAFEKGDLDSLGKSLADDVRWNILGRREPVIGKKAFLEVCSSAPFEADSVKITVTNMIIEGKKAAVESLLEAVTSSGETYQQRVCDIYRFDGEKIQELTTYLDTAYDRDILGEGSIHPD